MKDIIISDDIIYIGADDKDIELFENQYNVPNGVAYNSYIIIDKKIAIMDTIDKRKTSQWLKNLEKVLNGRNPDYLVISHLEPDHAYNIDTLIKKYPNIKLVGNSKTFTFLPQFFDIQNLDSKKIEVKEGEILDIGNHKIKFIMAQKVQLTDEKLTEVTKFTVETSIINSTTSTDMMCESTTSIIAAINDEKNTEKQLVKEILLIDDLYYSEENAEEHAEKDAELMVNNAEPFSEISLGSITSEEDAKEKGRSIFIEWLGQKFVDDLESDFVIRDENPIKFERDDPPYSVTYYEKYDAWIIKTDLRSGKTEDGGWIATPGSPRYVILRGSDGKVLAVY